MDSKTPPQNYYDNVNWDLLRRCPKSSSKVLEIGCGGGALGREFKRFNPSARYVGIELFEDAAARARDHIDRVVVGDIESMNLTEALADEGPFDLMVFGDVLEHLRDPAALLRKLLPLLDEDGVAVACIPNVAYWEVLRDLMGGNWTYRDAGIMDRTHLRFFTLPSMQALFSECGMVVNEVLPRRFPGEKVERFVKAMRPAIENLGLDVHQFQERAMTMQYVLTVTRKPVEPLLLQAMSLRPVGAVNDVRIDLPMGALSALPGVRTAIASQTTDLKRGKGFQDKIFIYHRPILTFGHDLANLKRFLAEGYVIVVEFDDHPMRWPVIRENDYLTYKGVHGVQTSTEPLAEMFLQFNPEVATFPNSIVRLPPPRDHDGDGPVRLFFGALNRKEDWAPIMPALNNVLRARADRVAVTVVHDQDFFDALDTQAKTFHPLCDYGTYQNLLGECDISLMPLRDDEFNRMKSDLKFIEAAANGVVPLASPVVYGRSVKDGETGVLAGDPQAFESALIALIDDDDRRRRIGAAARRYVIEERMLAYQAKARMDWYRSLLERREELTRKLYERVPRLKE